MHDSFGHCCCCCCCGERVHIGGSQIVVAKHTHSPCVCAPEAVALCSFQCMYMHVYVYNVDDVSLSSRASERNRLEVGGSPSAPHERDEYIY